MDFIKPTDLLCVHIETECTVPLKVEANRIRDTVYAVCGEESG